MTSSPTLRTGPDGTLRFMEGESWIPVSVHRCFPWKQPTGYLSLVDPHGRERALIRSLADLDSTSRRAAEEALTVVGFTLEIDRIHSLVREIEIRSWRVDVGGKPRRFQTALDEWPRRLENGRVVILDVAGDLYSIADPEALDRRSRELLWALID